MIDGKEPISKDLVEGVVNDMDARKSTKRMAEDHRAIVTEILHRLAGRVVHGSPRTQASARQLVEEVVAESVRVVQEGGKGRAKEGGQGHAKEGGKAQAESSSGEGNLVIDEAVQAEKVHTFSEAERKERGVQRAVGEKGETDEKAVERNSDSDLFETSRNEEKGDEADADEVEDEYYLPPGQNSAFLEQDAPVEEEEHPRPEKEKGKGKNLVVLFKAGACKSPEQTKKKKSFSA